MQKSSLPADEINNKNLNNFSSSALMLLCSVFVLSFLPTGK